METERKTLKCSRKMSDVERICHMNHERRMQETAQYTDYGITAREAEAKLRERISARKRKNCMRTACTACMMVTGGGAAFVGMGLVMGDLATVVIGLLVAVTFLISGTHLEDAAYRGGCNDYV
jgi:hypothetical protein